LDGLPIDYMSLVTLIQSKSKMFHSKEIKALFFAHEHQIEKLRSVNENVSQNVTEA